MSGDARRRIVRVAVPLLAMAAYLGYWLWFLRASPTRNDLPGLGSLPIEAVYVLGIGGPAFALGVIGGRWWVVLAGAALYAAPLLGGRCEHPAFDLVVCHSAADFEDMWWLVLLTTPCILLGVLARHLLGAWLTTVPNCGTVLDRDCSEHSSEGR